MTSIILTKCEYKRCWMKNVSLNVLPKAYMKGRLGLNRLLKFIINSRDKDRKIMINILRIDLDKNYLTCEQ